MGITYQEVDVTPSMATSWLQMMKCNRSMRVKHANTIAHEIKNGRWRENGETIKFDQNGFLIDGQHRLKGVVISGITVRMIIVRGVSSEAQPSINGGIPNKVSDYLQFVGYTNTRNLAAAVRLLWTYLNGFFPEKASAVTTPPSQETFLDLLGKHPSLCACVNAANKAAKSGNSRIMPISSTSFLCHIVGGIENQRAVQFLEQLYIGENLKSDSAVFHLRLQMIANIGAKQRYTDLDKMAKLIKAWNCHFEERPATNVAAIRWTRLEPFPRPKGAIVMPYLDA